jgi:acetyltransferase-like isoleucine patch superfamily enzyme
MRAVLRGLARLLRTRDAEIRVAWRRLRQRAFVARVTLLAKLERSTVSIELAPDVRIGRGVRVNVWPGTHTTLSLGARSVIGEGVTFHLKGGELRGGVQTELRPDAAIHLGGRLTLDGENRISYGCVLHCAEEIQLGYATIVGEHAGIADSTHFHTTPDAPVLNNVATAPVHIGRNTFLCPRVSIGRGVTVGAWTVIGPGSVVSKDIPAGVFASGIPAVVVRDLEHPWMKDIASGDEGAPDPAWPANVPTRP